MATCMINIIVGVKVRLPQVFWHHESCANANKMDTNRVNTTQRSMNWKHCTEISPREIQLDLDEFTSLECNN